MRKKREIAAACEARSETGRRRGTERRESLETGQSFPCAVFKISYTAWDEIFSALEFSLRAILMSMWDSDRLAQPERMRMCVLWRCAHLTRINTRKLKAGTGSEGGKLYKRCSHPHLWDYYFSYPVSTQFIAFLAIYVS